jgi:hypothetical protein
MRAPIWARKTSTLTDSIEIIREPKDPNESKTQTPSYPNDSNPISMLKTLVETIESLIDYGSKKDRTTDNLEDDTLPEHTTSDAERYIELFQKQNVILRKMMSKLN